MTRNPGFQKYLRAFAGLLIAFPCCFCQTPNTDVGPTKSAHLFAGIDCGSKINAADRSLAEEAGEIQVDRRCGFSSKTPVILRARHVIRFMEGGTFTFSSITMAGMAPVIVGPPASMGSGSTQGAVLIKQAASSNSAAFLSVTGANAVIRDISIDGNLTQNPRTEACLRIDKSIRTHLENITVQNCANDGIQVRSYRNESVAPKLFHVIALNNGGRGFYCENTTDAFVTQSEFENNARSGIELFNCGGARITGSDIGGNGSNRGLPSTCPRIASSGWLIEDAIRCPGVFLHGKVSSGTPNNNGVIITSTQFGNNYADDLLNYGFDKEANQYVSFAHLFNNNYFAGGTNHGRDEFDAVHSSDAGFSSIVGNVVFSGNDFTNYRWGVHTQESRPGANNPDEVCANVVHNILRSSGGDFSVTSNASTCDKPAGKL